MLKVLLVSSGHQQLALIALGFSTLRQCPSGDIKAQVDKQDTSARPLKALTVGENFRIEQDRLLLR